MDYLSEALIRMSAEIFAVLAVAIYTFVFPWLRAIFIKRKKQTRTKI